MQYMLMFYRPAAEFSPLHAPSSAAPCGIGAGVEVRPVFTATAATP